jgi:hypothetical protein
LAGGGAGEVQPAHRDRGEGASAQAQTFRVQDTKENQKEGRLSQVLFWLFPDPIRDFRPIIDIYTVDEEVVKVVWGFS